MSLRRLFSTVEETIPIEAPTEAPVSIQSYFQALGELRAVKKSEAWRRFTQLRPGDEEKPLSMSSLDTGSTTPTLVSRSSLHLSNRALVAHPSEHVNLPSTNQDAKPMARTSRAPNLKTSDIGSVPGLSLSRSHSSSEWSIVDDQITPISFASNATLYAPLLPDYDVSRRFMLENTIPDEEEPDSPVIEIKSRQPPSLYTAPPVDASPATPKVNINDFKLIRVLGQGVAGKVSLRYVICLP